MEDEMGFVSFINWCYVINSKLLCDRWACICCTGKSWQSLLETLFLPFRSWHYRPKASPPPGRWDRGQENIGRPAFFSLSFRFHCPVILSEMSFILFVFIFFLFCFFFFYFSMNISFHYFFFFYLFLPSVLVSMVIPWLYFRPYEMKSW